MEDNGGRKRREQRMKKRRESHEARAIFSLPMFYHDYIRRLIRSLCGPTIALILQTYDLFVKLYPLPAARINKPAHPPRRSSFLNLSRLNRHDPELCASPRKFNSPVLMVPCPTNWKRDSPTNRDRDLCTSIKVSFDGTSRSYPRESNPLIREHLFN